MPSELVALRGQLEGQQNHPCVVVLTGASLGSVFRLTERENIVGRSDGCDISLEDERISRQHVKLIRSESGEILVQDLESTNGTYKDGRRVSLVPLGEGERINVGGTTLLRLSLSDETEESFRRLYESSIRDGLTGVHNRKYFDERLEAEFSFASRHGTPLSLIMLDLDHFKAVNDTHGHRTGDHVLRNVSALLQASIRVEDTVARYGGEEFAILVPGVDLEHAGAMAERIRSIVAGMAVYCDDEAIQITVSAGVATLNPTRFGSCEELVSSSDRALYLAKDLGRNRVELSE